MHVITALTYSQKTLVAEVGDGVYHLGENACRARRHESPHLAGHHNRIRHDGRADCALADRLGNDTFWHLAERRVPRQVRNAAPPAASTPLDFPAQLLAAKFFLATVSQQRSSFKVLHKVRFVIVVYGHLRSMQRISSRISRATAALD